MATDIRSQVHSWAAPSDGVGSGSDKMPFKHLHRTQTEVAAASEPERSDEKQLKHRRIHSRGLRSKGFTSGSHHVQHAKETVQSAIELMPPIQFVSDHLLRRDKKSPAVSRRGSTGAHNPQHPPGSDPASNWQDQQREATKQRTIRPRDVARTHEKNAQRVVELRRSLLGVEQTAMHGTRQLDDTYYGILEKASLLRSTVASLQQLANECRRLQTDFDHSSDKLAKDTRQNLDAFANLDAQSETIDDLVGKLEASKHRTKELNERLDAARGRMEAFEQREGEREKVLRKRWWTCWAVVMSLTVMVIAFIIAKHRSAVGGTVYSVAKALDDLGGEVKAPVVKLLRPKEKEDDPYLKELFDDL